MPLAGIGGLFASATTSDGVLFAASVPTWVAPLWIILVIAAIALGALFVAYFAIRIVQPKIAAIAVTTCKEGVSQPLFYVLLLFGSMLLLVFPFLPYNTLGEDVKVVKDSGCTLIMVSGILLALWTASISLADEIEGRTALTLLSKPVGRRQFIIGKFVGVLGPVAYLFIFLSSLFLATISYKVVYDAKENASPDPTVAQCRGEMLHVVAPLVLAFLETVVLASISVAISTRLPMLANLIICSSIYALGHLVPAMVNSATGRFPILLFVSQLIATILPVLENFDVETAIATGQPVSLSYLGLATVYCLLLSSVSLLLALLLFEDRDLA